VFSFTNDPDADGVGIAFFDAVSPSGGRFDLSLGSAEKPRGADWDVAERALGISLFTTTQVHGNRVVEVSSRSDVSALADVRADALVSTSRKVGLAVRAADCLPVLLADADAGVIGAAHAGRVGLADGVLVAVLAHMRSLGASEISAWIGPHICASCYEVSAELQRDYCQLMPGADARTSWGTPSLDLGRAASEQLARGGCAVSRLDPCTMTTSTLHSYRRDGALAGRQAGAVWLP
jgi:polyphenol oxidase